MIGSIQWTISIGRLDVATAVMYLSGYRSIRRIGHMERAKRVIDYLVKMKYAVNRFKIGLPSYSDTPHINYD